MAIKEATMIDEMLEPLAEVLTPEMAKLLAGLQAKPAMQAQIDRLAAKCNEGELTPEEQADYEAYVRIGHLFALIKAKANRILAESAHG